MRVHVALYPAEFPDAPLSGRTALAIDVLRATSAAVAACEAAVALALFLALYRRRRSLDSSDWQELRELGVPPAIDEEPLPEVKEEPLPTLTPAGARPEEGARA